MVTKTKGEPLLLTRDLATTETDIGVSTGEGNQLIWEYLVPVGQALVFSPRDTFSAYLYSFTLTAEAAAGSSIEVAVVDPSRQASKSLLNTVRYTVVKEFQDREKMARLDVPVGEEVIVPEGWRIQIKGNINGTLTAASSYFSLTCLRLRKSIL